MTHKKIVLVISSLSSGGAERVMVTLANNFASRGYNVSLITYRDESFDWYEVDNEVKRIVTGYFDHESIVSFAINYFKKTLQIRKLFINLNPDIIISFLTEVNVVTLLASLGLNKKIIISERVDPTMHHDIFSVWKRLRRLTYHRANKLVVQTESIARYYSQWSGVKTVVIPNPVSLTQLTGSVHQKIKKPFIVGMGRLSAQKGFDLLITSFAKVADRYPKWNLVIVGEGEKRGELEKLVNGLKLKGRVFLIGRVKDSVSILKQANIFVLSSRYEGFPNALLEAMASGLPAISFNCPSGPAEIIRHNRDGILVPSQDTQKLACAIGKLVENKTLRQNLGKNAREVTTRFSVDKIISKWEKLVN